MSKFQAVLDAAGTRTTHKEKASSVPQETSRKRGKRQDPDYEQVTVYMRRDTHREAKKILLDRDLDFSELVQKLVADWMKASNSKKS
jgi:hypothetical protein